MFLVHNILIRKHVNVPGIEDARDFLLRNVHKFGDKHLEKFKRPLHMMGTRVFFPPVSGDKTSFDIKIETALDDYKKFFIESKGIFPQPVDMKKNPGVMEASIKKTESFIDTNIIDFLTQFI